MYKIYKHTFPDGSYYVGMTGQDLDVRAGLGGANYKKCPEFFEAIMQTGWDAIEHEVLARTDNKEEAKKLEEFYINYYKQRGDKTYNIYKVFKPKTIHFYYCPDRDIMTDNLKDMSRQVGLSVPTICRLAKNGKKSEINGLSFQKIEVEVEE